MIMTTTTTTTTTTTSRIISGSSRTQGISSKKHNNNQSPGAKFLQALSDKEIDLAMSLIMMEEQESSSAEGSEQETQTTVEFEDTDFPFPWNRNELERNLRLRARITDLDSNDSEVLVVDKDIYDPTTAKAGVVFHLEKRSRERNSQQETKGAAFFQLNDAGLIRKAFLVKENDKSGEINLKILKIASEIIDLASSSSSSSSTSSSSRSEPPINFVDKKESNNNNGLFSLFISQLSSPPSSSPSVNLAEEYFDAWNQRDMKRAVSVFSTNVEYDDTAFPEPFSGIDSLERHLNICADALPPSFSFVLDDKIVVGDQIMVRWHVENGSEELPFTRGCSYYEIENGKIARGTDLKEPAVFKIGGLSLFVKLFVSQLKKEPIRLVPLVVWMTYCYVVFFSEWFFGLPAQALETRTWEEVRDLSLNFFLVSPILGLPFAPVVHPGLEGIFNLLLSWAALFAGFLSDDRPNKKPNLIPMLPTVLGMQFLTSAFLLPYLATRSSENEENIVREDLNFIAQATESKLFAPAMAVVGTGSIVWGLFAREQEFGGLQERFFSLIDLLSIDRVGSSFVVDLAIFGLFQGWLVDDDVKRRGMDAESPLVNAAKYVPFFGMVAYLTYRTPIPSQDDLH
jgi:hypothetical protein